MSKKETSQIEASYQTVVDAYNTADALKKEYVARMQETTGYDVAEGVTILKDEAGKVSGVTHAGTFYSVRAAQEKKFMVPISVKPPQELLDAIANLDGVRKEFQNLVAGFTITVSTKTPSASGRTPSKGFVSQEEWESIPTLERQAHDMQYDGTTIILKDGDGKLRRCKSVGKNLVNLRWQERAIPA